MKRIFSSSLRRRVLLWTLGLHLVALALAWRIHWDTQAGQPPPNAAPTPPNADATPDPSAQALGAADLEALLGESSAAWNRSNPAEREAALQARLDDLRGMSPEAAAGAASHVADTLRVPNLPVHWVPLEEIDTSNAVPVDMENGTNDQAEPGMWVALQDAQGRRARLWIPAADIGEEERQALRVFELLKQNPSLDALRPVLTHILQGMAGDGK